MTTPSPIAIRPATAADAPVLFDIFTRSIAELAPPFYTRPQVAAWSAALTAERSLALITDHTTYVAELESSALGGVFGFATFAEPDEFDMLYVDPTVVMRGVGAALAAVVEQHARSHGVHELRATVSDCARLAFESFGYRHELPHTRTLDGVEFSVTLMSLRLR
jgi:L-amino acid N-acyltransferase YncA